MRVLASPSVAQRYLVSALRKGVLQRARNEHLSAGLGGQLTDSRPFST